MSLVESLVQEITRGPLDPLALMQATPAEQREALEIVRATAQAVLGLEDGAGASDELLGLGALHPSPHVRRAVVETVIAAGAGTDAQRELLCWAVNDADTALAATAARACEGFGLVDALLPLADSLGRAPQRMDGNLAGVTDYASYFATRAASALRPDALDPQDAARAARDAGHEFAIQGSDPDVSGMVLIPAGDVTLGLGTPSAAPGWLPHDGFLSVRRTAHVDSFYIDEHSVTNAQYDAFVESSFEHDHQHCHPDEPPGTDHRRATLLDDWAAPDHPVTGVSWFDAYSYAAFHGKRLPSDVEWEYAAGGSEGQAFPWGDDFRAGACRWLGTAVGRSVDSIADWAAALELLIDDATAPRTAADQDQPDNISPFGVRGMTGNTWEWTRSRYLDGVDIQPRGWSPADMRMQGDWTAIACVKGGSWASGGEMLLNAYRGKLQLHRRGPETGFRCVVPAGD